LINVRLAPGTDWKSNAAMQQAIAQVEAELADQGRVLIRASGTEPVVRVMVEARDAQVAKASAERIAQTLQ
jgi:phosphoglucosamine mutase